MSTPTATPRTDDGLLAVALACEHCTESVHLYGADMKGHGADIRRVLAELAAEREKVRVLREALESLAYWSRNNTETRQTLRDRIRVRLDVTKEGSA